MAFLVDLKKDDRNISVRSSERLVNHFIVILSKKRIETTWRMACCYWVLQWQALLLAIEEQLEDKTNEKEYV